MGPGLVKGLASSDLSELRCDQCHSVSPAAFDLFQLETPRTAALISLGQGAKRYQKRTRSETWIAVRANGRNAGLKNPCSPVHCIELSCGALAERDVRLRRAEKSIAELPWN